MSEHRCYIAGVDGPVVRVAEEQAHHLLRVLRLRVGDSLVVFDGRGGEWDAVVRTAARGGVTVDLVAPRVPTAEPPVHVTLAVALLKGDQMSDVVRDATALGAGAIVPFVSGHVAVPGAAARARSIERWRRIAVSSAAQCGRAVVPAVHDMAHFDDLLADGLYQERWMCVEPRRQAAVAVPAPVAPPAAALLMVGPEGGWSAEEIIRGTQAGALPLQLGPRTLRAEIAPTVALSVLWARWGWTRAEAGTS